MPTSGLCRPLAQNGLWRWRSLRWSRHNHSASRNARRLSFGRKRPGVANAGAVAASARAAQTVVIVSSLLFGGLFFLMFVFACIIPLFTLVTKERKAAEYEWRRLWWVK